MKTPYVRLARRLFLGTFAAGLTVAAAHAQLTSSYQFNGNGDWSLSAVGSNNTPVGNLQAIIPVGSTITKAFLYSSVYSVAGMPNITLAGTNYSGSDWTQLPFNSGASYLDAFRADVTTQMQTAVGGGSASTFNFSVTENTNNGGTDGEVLAIVFSNPGDPTRTIAFLDGALSSSGATTTINYATPLANVGTPGFSAEMSIGDGFSYQVNSPQYSIIDVNGRRLTTSAGGADDGQPANGALITVGGIGDSTANPVNPYLAGGSGDTTRYDDELYDLGQGNGVNASPFVSNGDTTTVINTSNPSHDDNIFFLGLNVTAAAGVNQPPPPSAPDATSTTLLMALGLGALGFGYKSRRSSVSRG